MSSNHSKGGEKMGAKQREFYKDKINDMYKNGCNLTNIATKLEINRFDVKKVLIEAQLYEETRKYIKEDKETQQKIIDLYENHNLPLREIEKHVDYNLTTIKRFIRTTDVRIKHAGEYNRKYSCNENAFSEYTPESCYWAGFIAGDGCVFSHGLSDKTINNSLNIGLSSVDTEHLEKFKEFLSYTGVIYYNENSSALNVNCRKIVSDLEKNYNITNNKTDTYIPPTSIPCELEKYFILGLLDSDGCITRTTRPTQRNHIAGQYVYSVGFTGTLECCNYVKAFFNSKVKIHKRHKNDSNNYSVLLQGNLQIIKLLTPLYDDISRVFCLSRKLKRFDDLLEQYSI